MQPENMLVARRIHHPLCDGTQDVLSGSWETFHTIRGLHVSGCKFKQCLLSDCKVISAENRAVKQNKYIRNVATLRCVRKEMVVVCTARPVSKSLLRLRRQSDSLVMVVLSSDSTRSVLAVTEVRYCSIRAYRIEYLQSHGWYIRG